MGLDFVGAICSKASNRIKRHQAFHEVSRFRRNLDKVFMPLDVPGKDVYEHLFWSVSVEGGDTVQKLICDDAQGPLVCVSASTTLARRNR